LNPPALLLQTSRCVLQLLLLGATYLGLRLLFSLLVLGNLVRVVDNLLVQHRGDVRRWDGREGVKAHVRPIVHSHEYSFTGSVLSTWSCGN
jgi:hypothetical protein